MPEGQNMFEGFWGHLTEFIKRMKIVLGVFVVSLFIMLDSSRQQRLFCNHQQLQTPNVRSFSLHR